MKLRKATLEDCKFIWDLRYSNDGMQVSTSKWINYDHFMKTFKDIVDEFKIIMDEDRRIGYLRKDKSDFISIMLSSEYRGKGIGTEILKEVTGKATILFDNVQSIKSFIKAGWEIRGLFLTK